MHPAELYEAALGLALLPVAALLLRRPHRDGAVFRAVLALYAAGRFLVEILRGDANRGALAGLSTAQWTSLAVLAALALWSLTTPAERAPVARGA